MSGTAHPVLVVLDVNETLSDMAPLAGAFEAVGAPGWTAEVWFAATLRDGFALGITGSNPAFADVAKDVLRGLLAPYVEDEEHREEAVGSVLTAFGGLRVHDDVPAALRDLREAGVRVVTLGNGSASVARGLLERAGVLDLVEETLSVEDAPAWKPDRRAYAWAVEHCGVTAEEAMLVAAHPWDVTGAALAGLQTAWVDRRGTGYPTGFRPADVVVPGLGDLPMALTAG